MLSVCCMLQFLEDMGLQGDAIPLGREVTGIVQRVGPKVTFFQPDDEVVGILPLDSVCSGLSDVIDINEQYLVEKPSKLSCTSVAAALEDGLRAYTALHTHARMAAGQTLLVLDGASSFGLMCIQLASYHGVKVLTTSRSQEQHSFLEQLRPSVGVQEPLVARVIPVHKNPSKLLPAVLEETGGLGVDIVVDQGVSLREKEQPEEEEEEEEEEEAATFLPHKHDIIIGSSRQQVDVLEVSLRVLPQLSSVVGFVFPAGSIPPYSSGHRGEDVVWGTQTSTRGGGASPGRGRRHGERAAPAQEKGRGGNVTTLFNALGPSRLVESILTGPADT
ncbi:quinone oxidoreductase-like protein 1 isoform X4 [Syngnathoides biaculeatus]|uniref:quinone oxidoreductase-like protein 1 isoform X4 n=1 Tax=Syngnathoides biaculeatus TaxID=300417 RepID=UPI002ADE1724|nr:quinone oxidoreductase-like protein 1 isoform X4 [Syngnathoides biaculeatus]XP_061693294.1 quinone oxidoreductase-like protein 1 isoform X4 [Syngnathoides biaculeatus]